MIDNLRAASNHLVPKVILGLIILSFVLTGVGTYIRSDKSDYAAKVNGQEISRAYLDMMFRNEQRRQQQILGDQFLRLTSNNGYLQRLRQQTLSNLIDQALLDQYIKDLHISISDDEVRQAIFLQQAFQTNGKFDNAKYNAILHSMGSNADRYAEALRKHLAAQQLINTITNTDFILPDETGNLIDLVSQKRDIRHSTIDINALTAKQNITDNELLEYYQQHKDSFIEPEQFRVSYIKIDDIESQKNVNHSKKQSWHDQNKTNKINQKNAFEAFFQQQKQREAASNNNDALVAAAQDAGVKIKETSWFSRDNVPRELDFDAVKNVIFNSELSSKKGALGNNPKIITLDRGLLVLNIREHKPAGVKSLVKVKAQITGIIKRNKAEEQAKVQGAKILAYIKAGKLNALSMAELNLSASKTVDRNSQDPIAQTAFNLPPPIDGKPSWGLSKDMQGNVVLVALTKVNRGSLPQEQIDEIIKILKQENTQLEFNAILANLRKEAKIKYGAMTQIQ